MKDILILADSSCKMLTCKGTNVTYAWHRWDTYVCGCRASCCSTNVQLADGAVQWRGQAVNDMLNSFAVERTVSVYNLCPQVVCHGRRNSGGRYRILRTSKISCSVRDATSLPCRLHKNAHCTTLFPNGNGVIALTLVVFLLFSSLMTSVHSPC